LTIVVDEHNDVLTVPNAALRFTPAGMTPEKIAEMLQTVSGPPEVPGAQSSPAQPPAAGSEAAGAPGAPARGANAPDGQRGRGNRGGGGARGGGGGRGGGRGGGQGRPQRGVLWIEDKPGEFRPVPVRIGLTDGTRTEVMAQNLEEGTEILVSDLSQTTTPAARPTTNLPFGVPQFGGGRGGRGGF
jgi:HlyD family secretion protein